MNDTERAYGPTSDLTYGLTSNGWVVTHFVQGCGSGMTGFVSEQEYPAQA